MRRVVPRRTAARGPRRRRRRRGASATTRLGRMPRRAVAPRAASRPRTGARRPGNLSRRGGRSALRSSGERRAGRALFVCHVTALSLGPRETRDEPRRGATATESGRPARASRARPAAGAHAAPSRARRAFRLPASSSRALFSYPTRVTTRDRRFPRSSRNARVRRAKARRAARRDAAPRATKTARPCASARRAGSSEARCASTRGPARSRDRTGFFRRVLGVRGQPRPPHHSRTPCARLRRGGARFATRYRARD